MTDRLVLSSATRTAHLTVERVEQDEYTGSLSAMVEVDADGFAGTVDRVWFDRGALDDFGDALARFERERSGRVSICNTGVPDATNEVTMFLEARTGGHAVLVLSLKQVRSSRSASNPHELTVRFDVDGGDLGRFASEWRSLFEERSEPAAE